MFPFLRALITVFNYTPIHVCLMTYDLSSPVDCKYSLRVEIMTLVSIAKPSVAIRVLSIWWRFNKYMLNEWMNINKCSDTKNLIVSLGWDNIQGLLGICMKYMQMTKIIKEKNWEWCNLVNQCISMKDSIFPSTMIFLLSVRFSVIVNLVFTLVRLVAFSQ